MGSKFLKLVAKDPRRVSETRNAPGVQTQGRPRSLEPGPLEYAGADTCFVNFATWWAPLQWEMRTLLHNSALKRSLVPVLR